MDDWMSGKGTVEREGEEGEERGSRERCRGILSLNGCVAVWRKQ